MLAVAKAFALSDPGEGEAGGHADSFTGLKTFGCQDFVSLECGCKGRRSDAIPAAVRLRPEQWQMAAGCNRDSAL